MESDYCMLLRCEAEEYLKELVGQPLSYGLKSPDMDLYDIGFGKCQIVQGWHRKNRYLCPYIIHAVCCIKIVGRDSNSKTAIYTGDTTCEQFHMDVQNLIGLTVDRIALSEKNDLWIDLGKYWLVIITYEDEIESWRFFASDNTSPHLVVTNTSIEIN